MADLLVAGGSRDPNLTHLCEVARGMGVDCLALLVDAEQPPRFSWSLADGEARLDGGPLRAGSAFLRYDVFSLLLAPSAGSGEAAQAWFASFVAWCEVAGAFTFNRKIHQATGSKIAMLHRAQKAGLPIPPTLLSSDRAAIDAFAHGPAIAKPVAGGSYVMGLPDAAATGHWTNDVAQSPAIIQPQLVYPERRIYRIGSDWFAFDIQATTIDSRLDRGGEIVPLALGGLPDGVIERLGRLTDRLRCDFCAVDMKTDPATGELLFLELNNGPMFVGYDRAAGGTLSAAMVRYLVAGGKP